MKAIIFDFSKNAFTLSDIPVPKPTGNDVLIKVEYCGLNPVDAKIHQWQNAIPNRPAYWVTGLDVSGVIVEIGSNVTAWKEGDKVLCHGDRARQFGGFAEYTIQAADMLIPHPDVAADVAAATPCSGWTALRALTDKLKVTSDDSILITGGSGGVGIFAVQLAKHFGLNPVIATCSDKNIHFVRELGADYVIDYKSENIAKRIAEITGDTGVTTGIDTVGGENDIIVANALAYEGRMVELVRTLRPEVYYKSFMRGLSFHQLSLGSGHRHDVGGKKRMIDAGKQFTELLQQGIISVPRLTTISFEEIPDALQKLLEQRTVGKIVAAIS